jgi:hypothetical protein
VDTALPRIWCCRDNGNAMNTALELMLHTCDTGIRVETATGLKVEITGSPWSPR